MFKPLVKFSLASTLLLPTSGYTASDYLKGHLGALSNQASESVGNVPGNRYNADIEFDYYNNPSTSYTRGVERRFSFAVMQNDQSLTTYSLQEAYLGGGITSKDYVKAGRHIIPWSQVDTTWGFGKINNRRNFDFFTPGQEGLTGISYERRSSNGMRYRLFGSGLYIPELNPPLDINESDKTITSRHPWANAPARTAVVETNVMNIQYNVDMPEVNDIIYRYSGGGNIGFESDHWVFDNFFMRKPENQITPHVEVDISFAENLIKADIDPRVYYQDLYGSTLKYRNRDVELYASGIAIRPNTYPDVNENVRYTEIKNRKRREDYLGFGISRSNDLYTLGFNYVARLSPFDRENDDLSQDPRWNQAVNFLASRNFGRHYSIMGDVKYDMLTTDRLVMLRGTYNASKNMQLNVGVNMIGTPSDGKSFWSPYTNNDAIYGGLRYVF